MSREFEDNKQKSKTVGGKSKNKFWFVFGMVAVTLAVLAGAVYRVNEVVTNSELCANCHEMRPEYYTWQYSSHSKVKCTDCHLPLDKAQRIMRNFQGVRQVVEHFTGTYSVPFTLRQQIFKENCLVCHSINRKATPSGDLIISHTTHDNRGVECLSCHNGVVHGRIVERGKVNKVAPENWTSEMGMSESRFVDTKPQMIQCLQCHRQWKLSTKCEKCHKKIPTSPSHQPVTWRILHGKEAWQDVNRCSQCHYDSRLEDSFNKDAVSQYIRSNQFCYGCHLKYKPPSHMDAWPHNHASQVVKGEIPYCVTCHDLNEPQDRLIKGTFTYCNKCHGQFQVGNRKVESL